MGNLFSYPFHQNNLHILRDIFKYRAYSLTTKNKSKWQTLSRQDGLPSSNKQFELPSDEEDRMNRVARRTNPCPEKLNEAQIQSEKYEGSNKFWRCFNCCFAGHWVKAMHFQQ